MRYLLGTEIDLIAISRQECLDEGVDPNAVTQYWYDWKETVTPGVWALMIWDDKNPVQGLATTTVEPEWPVYEMRQKPE